MTLALTRSNRYAPLAATPASRASEITLGELLTRKPEQLGGADIALANLLCAQDLPGSEKLEIRTCLDTLDRWARKVKTETDRHLYRVHDPGYADRYKGSEGLFRMEMLCQVLQEGFGVRYNVDRVTNIDFRNSKDLFILGVVGDPNGGTCLSMPVLYTAIARRLGYPVKLVEAKSHLFCRWEGMGPDGKVERFNIEGAGAGFSSHDDDYYRTWPKLISEAEIKRGEYLKTLSPAEELAVFFAARGHCLYDSGRVHEAQVAYARAHQLHPASRDCAGFLAQAVARSTAQFVERNVWQPVPRYAEFEHQRLQVGAINAENRRRLEAQTMGATPRPAGPFIPPPGAGARPREQ